VPEPPLNAPTRGDATKKDLLEVFYEVYSLDGGAPIISYGLEIDRNDGSGFTEVVDAA
jgi:hypothetical protein